MQFLEPTSISNLDPGIAIGPAPGSAPGSYTLYALLAPAGPGDAAGSYAIIGTFLYNAAKRTFKYQHRYPASTRHTVSFLFTDLAGMRVRIACGKSLQSCIMYVACSGEHVNSCVVQQASL